MRQGRRGVVVAVAGLAVAASVAVALTVGADRAARLAGGDASGKLTPPADAPPAPEFAGIAEWLNSRPLTMAGLRGKVVVVDFWTYSCINCRRTFPFLRALHETYADRGLVVVGVHSPEFDFEKIPANVERAVRRLDVTWPVAEDPDMATWKAYRNEYWPADHLVDREGRIRLLHIGEGGEADIEAAVRALLSEGGDPGDRRVADIRPDRTSRGITPELYLGTRGSPGDPVALAGEFTAAVEYVAAAEAGATVTLTFAARDVYAVLGPPEGTAALRHVEVLLDGAPIPPARRGGDVVERAGRTYVDIGANDLYHLVTGPSVGRGRLALRAVEPGVRWFTFTFGG